MTRSREAEALVVLWIHRSPTADLVPDEPQIWRDANDVADLARVVKARWANRHFVLRIARRFTFAPYLLGEALGVDDEALMGPAADHVHPVAHLHLEHEAPAVYFDELHSGGYLKTGRCRRLVTHIPSAPRLYRRQSRPIWFSRQSLNRCGDQQPQVHDGQSAHRRQPQCAGVSLVLQTDRRVCPGARTGGQTAASHA